MRGEGNHKIPGSFAPENMEKTGAERVKYSLACQHEDAISIKFVSYAQKCPTVLCTFAVALRKESVDRNSDLVIASDIIQTSLSARRAWIEIMSNAHGILTYKRSLSARRAWIEIWASGRRGTASEVALRKESVDRNAGAVPTYIIYGLSLSARRAWIEISRIIISVLGLESLSARRAWIEILLRFTRTAG